ncbi:HD domain-containing protein [Clostridium akagii]|uniref:HD domain-containing protein n=1 Tax=Clostridium akagii TaxID=91623 RepID=UPI00047D6265|nr:HD domain-containing protein [Clostridium akagii]
MVDKVMIDMIIYFGCDVTRINHAIKVYGFSKTIGELENLDKKEQLILEVTAILHDIGIKVSEEKYNSSSGKYQEIEGPAVAKGLLEKYNLPEDVLSRILYIIGNHHSYNKIDGNEFQILVEADCLVNIFEDKMDKQAIEHIKNKCFKTKSGLNFVGSIYQ